MSYNYAANETEKALVATVINYPEKLDYLELSPNDFTNKDYALIYEMAQSLRDKGKSVNIPVIIEKLAKRIPKDTLVEACNTLNAMPSSVESLAEVIRNNAVRRRMKEVGRKIMDLADNAEDVAEAIAEVEKEVSSIDVKRGKGGLKHIEDILEGAYDDLNARVKSKDTLTGIATGLSELDAFTAGWQKGDLVIIGARPSMGKTALMLNLATHVAKQGVAAVFSLEMSDKQLRDRLISAEGRIPLYFIRNGRLRDEDWSRFSGAVDGLVRTGMYIDDTSGVTVPYIRAELRRLRRQVGDVPMVAFIDYLQLIRVKGRSRQEELAEVSRSLKETAKELDTTVIALCQLSRRCEERQDKRPLLSDIRESGDIEQDADLVIFLYRDEYYNPKTEEGNIAELIIAKQRNGPTGTAKVGFLKDTQRFVDLSQRSE
jgi:replicative DNA helicase